jgi:hypothetical protein
VFSFSFWGFCLFSLSLHIRGHAILTIHIDSKVTDQIVDENGDSWSSLGLESSLKLGKLQFIDLASAERMGTESGIKYNSDQLADALYVNKSLSALSKSLFS